ncbi:MAG TPA: hypothetical protein VGS07_15915 [Thermoanaerobaculia bacterium]|nr:hypothetical protein [Thermoanaerobaculia bacterium]
MPADEDGGVLTRRALEALRGSRSHVQLVAGLGVVIVAGELALMATVATMEWRLPAGTAVFVAVGCGLVALACAVWAYRLAAYGVALGRLDAGNRELAVERALVRQRSLGPATAVAGAVILASILVPTVWVIRTEMAATAAVTTPPAPARSPPAPARPPAQPEPVALPLFSSSDSGFFVFSDELSTPEAPLGFRDLDRACQVAASSFVCLLNQGQEPVAGGMRLVTRSPEATFRVQWGSTHASIDVESPGGRRFSIRVAPPTGRMLTEGLYGGAKRFAALGVPELDTGGCNQSEGKFSVRYLEVSAGSLRRLTLDFERFCESHGKPLIGRISVEPGR